MSVVDDTPDIPVDESFEQMAKRLGVEIETGGGSTLVFLGPAGAAAAKRIVERSKISAQPDDDT